MFEILIASIFGSLGCIAGFTVACILFMSSEADKYDTEKEKSYKCKRCGDVIKDNCYTIHFNCLEGDDGMTFHGHVIQYDEQTRCLKAEKKVYCRHCIDDTIDYINTKK